MFVTVQIILPETAKYRKLKVRERVIYQGRTESFVAVIIQELKLVHQRKTSFKRLLKFCFHQIQPHHQLWIRALVKVKRAVLKSSTVKIEGIPVTGIIDTDSDIGIVSGDLFKTVVNAAELKEDFKPANK